MFPGHPAALNAPLLNLFFLQYGMVDILTEEFLKDIEGVPFTFKFDETTTSQVKKQYDAYISYWSRQYNEVVNVCAGSLFVGHCPARELVHHFYEMAQPAY